MPAQLVARATNSYQHRSRDASCACCAHFAIPVTFKMQLAEQRHEFSSPSVPLLSIAITVRVGENLEQRKLEKHKSRSLQRFHVPAAARGPIQHRLLVGCRRAFFWTTDTHAFFASLLPPPGTSDTSMVTTVITGLCRNLNLRSSSAPSRSSGLSAAHGNRPTWWDWLGLLLRMPPNPHHRRQRAAVVYGKGSGLESRFWQLNDELAFHRVYGPPRRQQICQALD